MLHPSIGKFRKETLLGQQSRQTTTIVDFTLQACDDALSAVTESGSSTSVPFFFNSRAATALSTPPEIPHTTLRTVLILKPRAVSLGCSSWQHAHWVNTDSCSLHGPFPLLDTEDHSVEPEIKDLWKCTSVKLAAELTLIPTTVSITVIEKRRWHRSAQVLQKVA